MTYLPIKAMSKCYDFIIVGAGTAGLTLAASLAQTYSVVVFESGVDNSNEPPISQPTAAPLLPLEATNRYFTMLGHSSDDHRYPIVAGETLGGSSSINTMQFTVGDPGTYNQWAVMVGDNAWSADAAQSILSNIQTFAGVAGNYTPTAHGDDGPLNVRQATANLPLAELWSSSFTSITGKGLVDPNDFSNSLGPYVYSQLTQQPDRSRESSWTAFFPDVKLAKPGKYVQGKATIYASTRVTKILHCDGKAEGVVVQRGGLSYDVKSRRGVILAAGFQSPSLLLQAGICNPNIGAHLFSHATLSVRGTPGPDFPKRPIGADEAALFVGGAVQDYNKDGQRTFQLTGSVPGGYGPDGLPKDSYTVTAVILRTGSNGKLRLIYPSPDRVSHVDWFEEDDPNFYPYCRYIYRIIFNTLALMGCTPIGPSPNDAAAVDNFIATNHRLNYDYTGGCLMGLTEQTAVVNNDCEVFGVEGLYVGDNSVMPLAAGGNTQANAYFIGKVLAGKLLAEKC